MSRPAPQWHLCTRTLDTVFQHASRGSRTLDAVLAVLDARPTQNSARLVQKHPELAAIVSHMAQMVPAEAVALASRLRHYIITRHAVPACRLDHVRAMEHYLRTVG